mmetsp:Transcript_82716/g.146009  ORF Transcript_82716/g.146009 Transcript_82716/m.146009 type:complete len:321 (+) Transcript_82716:24-986(+)|eukprot:CAMPEP_0197629016 /NCGR_PEP_ID=MMETSP1338-20131121/7057_1 /TAXON_ID=43686 ORGANISM="Pelagodinium beii, Strain RCC1491" /NCGR_SAMPLE_ID=MMETSP1338 /ASSEMBLY_ACC=CAM_ASM_000754 /LENGTH=320 /DNA_ID=CAMNT_0043200023 /DNA_START=24 /DNA_END=986 /DNA_ORIENTATION=+
MDSARRVPYYHYTNQEGLEGILGSGRIAPSDPKYGDAVEGRGAYGTNLPPSTRSKAIAQNNWDSGWQTAMNHGKLDRYVRCEVPATELRQVQGHGGLRQGKVLVHPKGIDLSQYPTKYGAVQDRLPNSTKYDAEYMGLYQGPNASTPSRMNSSNFNLSSPPKGSKPRQPSHNERTKVSSSDQPSRQALPCPYPSVSQWASSLPSDDEHDSGCDRGVESSGYNSQGNYYESYDDGSYRYENQDGSTYDCDADGQATYTSPAGEAFEYEKSDAGADSGCSNGAHSGGDDYGDGVYSEGGYSGGEYYSDGGYSDGYGDDGYDS